MEMTKTKLGGYQFYREILGSPKFIVAPMVDQSELAWRRMARRYGAQLIYTPMINAKMFTNSKYRSSNFDIASGEEGDPTTDRPLIVQFCANDPEKLLEAAKIVEPHCDAVDINLGCPQEIAKKGHYGSFLQDEWELIYKLINILHINLSIPVTAKFRVFPTVEKTVEYAKMLESAGAQILTCHGRLREQRGQNTGVADWTKIRAVKEAVSVPVFANGNILFQADVERCLQETGADGVMSAEGQLYNPALFAGLSPSPDSPPLTPEAAFAIAHPLHADLALEYLDTVLSLKTATTPSAVKGHLFKIMRPGLQRHVDLRDRLGRINVGGRNREKNREGWKLYVEVCQEMKRRMEADAAEALASGKSIQDLITIEPTTGLQVLPHWLAQPYFRPIKAPVIEVEGDVGKKKLALGKRTISNPTADAEKEEVKRARIEPVVIPEPEQVLEDVRTNTELEGVPEVAV
ncbi:Dus-domain-containing protein [Crucibulum laeve]|uniref:tRNA-dihydrouridine(16/17) synthase [NAD(P)(+)] n=1 Tax=Crucibulum laeve TaxID=68775 RepID=A0A5C3LGH0_9AGAR|nr:Dus-domain-containing protein [Crucibulum laeve]